MSSPFLAIFKKKQFFAFSSEEAAKIWFVCGSSNFQKWVD
jgi:hypothetical protein